MKTKRKVADVNHSEEYSTAVEDNHETATKVAPESAPPILNTGRGGRRNKAKHVDSTPPHLPISSSEREHSMPTLPVRTTKHYSGLGKDRSKTPKTEPSKRRWTRRPEHWRQIAEFYKNNSLEAALDEFPDDLRDYANSNTLYRKLNSWKKELENGVDIRTQPPEREPVYGKETERKLLDAVMDLLNAGNPVDDATLRGVLVNILTKEGRADMLIENGGTCAFRATWAARFWKKQGDAVKELRLKNKPPEIRYTKPDTPSSSTEGGGSVSSTGANGQKQPWTRRPGNWVQIAVHCAEHGLSDTVAAFPDVLSHLSHASAAEKLSQWRKDVADKKTVHRAGRPPAYGEEIENQLLTIVLDRLQTHGRMSDLELHALLVDLLTAAGMEYMLDVNGGGFSFSHGWANRFRKRHSLPTKNQNGRGRKRPVSVTGSSTAANGGGEEDGAATSGGVSAVDAFPAGGEGSDEF